MLPFFIQTAHQSTIYLCTYIYEVNGEICPASHKSDEEKELSFKSKDWALVLNLQLLKALTNSSAISLSSKGKILYIH